MDKRRDPQWQQTPETEASKVIESPNPRVSDAEILDVWTDDMFARAEPVPLRRPSFPQPPGLPEFATTFVPPYIANPPYSSMCKVYFTRGGVPMVASAWIVHGDTGIKGIITAAHVVYDNGQWSANYVVRRQYSTGTWAEQFVSNFARTLQGWIHQRGTREFWDVGAIIPSLAIGPQTPSLAAVWNYPYNQAPFNYYYDIGYPARPANGYPFNGELMWESDGSLIQAHWRQDEVALEAYNAMEHGSSGSPWLIYDAGSNTHYAAGVQSSGWNGTPASYSPYFDQRNIVALLRDINVLR